MISTFTYKVNYPSSLTYQHTPDSTVQKQIACFVCRQSQQSAFRLWGGYLPLPMPVETPEKLQLLHTVDVPLGRFHRHIWDSSSSRVHQRVIIITYSIDRYVHHVICTPMYTMLYVHHVICTPCYMCTPRYVYTTLCVHHVMCTPCYMCTPRYVYTTLCVHHVMCTPCYMWCVHTLCYQVMISMMYPYNCYCVSIPYTP